jgi:hypothetical protein
MNTPSDPDVVKITEVFLIPSSFLVAALGTADTNLHRAAVSLVGLVVSVLWWISSWEALADRRSGQAAAESVLSRRIRIMSWLPPFFVTCWAISVVCHLMLWSQPLGRDG